jgi:ElaB/YqjD/DUF883 family membrane-anchored ribosome-binding protein
MTKRRILDKEFEKEIKDKLDKGVKDARDKVDLGMKEVRAKAETARMALESEEEEVAEKIKEHPLKWVAGAFIAGLLVGKILSK